MTEQQLSLIPDPEGMDNSSEGGWGDYPLDSVFVRTETRTVSAVVERINAGRYILDPDFQRDFVWSAAKQSKLIESCVMRIPLPVFYVAEAIDGKIVIVDGLQRLTTFWRFIGNKLRLEGFTPKEGSSRSHALEGKLFSELPINLQERVLDTQLTMYILDAKAPERARLDIFERVNSGEPLTRQQMRNALYSGPATQWLKDAAAGAAFRQATGDSLDSRKMRDREAINRFCAFKLLGYKKYRTGDMDGYLADGLTALALLPPSSRDELRVDFDWAMNLSHDMFGSHAFRKSLAFDDAYAARSVLNISLFEVCAVTFSDIPDGVDDHALSTIKMEVINMINSDQEFLRAITYSTNSTNPVERRFERMEAIVTRALL